MQAATATDTQSDYKKTQVNQLSGAGTVVGAIQAAANRTGVDFAYLVNKASQESGLNPSAKATTSSATGLYQFVKQTWLQMVKEHGDSYGLGKEAESIDMKNGRAEVKDPAMREKILNMRHDPVLSAAMAAEFTKDNKDYLDASVGGNIGSTELYLAHFLGAGGAGKFLKNMRANPDASAAEILPQAAEANPSVFYDKSGKAKSLEEIYNRFASKFSEKGFNGVIANAMKENAGTSTTASAMPKRDFAEYSADFYQPPVAELTPETASDLNGWRQNGTTSDTLFNVMIMAQTSMNESIGSFVKLREDKHKV